MAVTHGAAWGVLVLRVVLGVILVMHGYAALAIVGPVGMAEYITHMGFSSGAATPLAWYLIVVDLVGGVLIILGLRTRVAAVLNIPIMLSAVLLLHWREGFFLKGVVVDAASRTATTAGYEYALLVLACTVAIALIGAGPFSFDGRTMLGRRR